MSDERFTLDTNVLIYAIDPRDPAKRATADAIIAAAARLDCWLTNQALAEFFSVAVRKMRMPPAVAAAHVTNWIVLFPGIETSRQAISLAMAEAEVGRLAFRDALLLASAAEAGCTLALSEDMAEGATLGGLVVRSPFAPGGGASPAARDLLGV